MAQTPDSITVKLNLTDEEIDEITRRISHRLATVNVASPVKYGAAHTFTVEKSPEGPPPFAEWPKIARLNRRIVVTEKIDGTNGVIHITDDGVVTAGSRTRWIRVGDDNFGFAGWVAANQDALIDELGPGLHYGEWWGKGIQRGYGLDEKRFSLFNTSRWNADNTSICHVVPVLYDGNFSETAILNALGDLQFNGSKASPGFIKGQGGAKGPEGVVVFHVAGNHMYKVTLERDEEPKGKNG